MKDEALRAQLRPVYRPLAGTLMFVARRRNPSGPAMLVRDWSAIAKIQQDD